MISIRIFGREETIFESEAPIKKIWSFHEISNHIFLYKNVFNKKNIVLFFIK